MFHDYTIQTRKYPARIWNARLSIGLIFKGSAHQPNKK